MLANIRIGFEIMGQSVKFFFKHPKSIFPVFITWVIYTGTVTYIYMNYDLSALTTQQILLLAYAFTFLFTFLVSVSSLILLELIEQNELEGKMSIFTALKDTLLKDLFRTIPIIICWSIIKFLLLLLEVIVRTAEAKSKKRSSFRRHRSRVASRAIDMLKDGVRMGVMLMLSAIAWEEISPKQAMSKGMYVYKSHFTSMVTGIALSRVLKLIVFLPVIVLLIVVNMGTTVHLYVWYGALIYTGLAWSYGILVEQLFTAELYLWYKLFKDQVELAERNGTPPPSSINDVKRPSFIDNIPDMVIKQNTSMSEWDY